MSLLIHDKSFALERLHQLIILVLQVLLYEIEVVKLLTNKEKQLQAPGSQSDNFIADTGDKDGHTFKLGFFLLFGVEF